MKNIYELHWWISHHYLERNLTNISRRFSFSFDIAGLNILDSIATTAREYHWQYVEFLSSKLSWRRTAVFLRWWDGDEMVLHFNKKLMYCFIYCFMRHFIMFSMQRQKFITHKHMSILFFKFIPLVII